jgi:hypothetical protein
MAMKMKLHNKKSVLLCDASFSSIPLLKALKDKGLYVGVCGSRLSDPCHSLADASFDIDYSEKKKLLKVFTDNHFNYLVPGCTDVSYISCAWVAGKLNLPGYDDDSAVKVINHKNEYRKIGKAMGYPIPPYETSVERFSSLNFPALLKPMSSFSGRGIIRFEHYSALKRFIDKGKFIGLEGNVLLEEFVMGDLYSHSAFLKSGKILIDFFVNEYCTIHPYQVNSSYLSTKLSMAIQRQMRVWLEKFASDLNLVDGLLHTQFISDGKNIYLIESCRRCPGDLYSLLIQKSTGINYASLFISPYIKSPFPQVGQIHRKNYSRHTLSIQKDVIFMSARLNIENSKITYVPIKKAGELLRAVPMDRAGIFFIESSTKGTMESLTKNLYKLAMIETLDMKF